VLLLRLLLLLRLSLRAAGPSGRVVSERHALRGSDDPLLQRAACRRRFSRRELGEPASGQSYRILQPLPPCPLNSDLNTGSQIELRIDELMWIGPLKGVAD
jgi:hypothetical protein